MKNLTIIFFAFVIIACSSAPTESKMQTAIVQNQAVLTSTPILLPTPTATLVPLAEIDLKLALLTNEELPTGLTATKTKDDIPNLTVPDPTRLIWQQIERGMEVAGGLRIYLYESKIDVENAYQVEFNAQGKIGKNISVSEIGEKAAIMTFHSNGKYITDIVFSRCYAVVTIRLDDKDAVLEYAKALDSRLISLVCR